jgi:hypothetical protein
MPIDLKALRVKNPVFKRLPKEERDQAATPVVGKGSRPWHRQGERFLKGPIPLNWLIAAAKQPKSAILLGQALWFLVGTRKSRTVMLSSRLAKEFGVGRKVKTDGLSALEAAGLVSIERRPNKNPIVTILDVPKESGPNKQGDEIRFKEL